MKKIMLSSIRELANVEVIRLNSAFVFNAANALNSVEKSIKLITAASEKLQEHETRTGGSDLTFGAQALLQSFTEEHQPVYEFIANLTNALMGEDEKEDENEKNLPAQ